MAAKVFNDKIRKLREEMGFTQTEVAEGCNLSVSKYVSIEDGRTGTTKATKPNIEQIAEFFKIGLDTIYAENFKTTTTIAFGYPKGGTGKSTLISETCYQLAVHHKKRILVVDGDHQANVTKTFGMSRNKDKSLRALLESDFEKDNISIDNFIQKTRIDGIDIIIADPLLNGVDRVLYSKPMSELVFYTAISMIIERGIYDYILIDTSPHLGALTTNLYFAADKYYMPIEMEPFALDSMESLVETVQFIKKLRKRMGMPDFNITKIIRTKVDLRERVTHRVTQDLENMMGKYLLDFYIPVDTNIKKAQYDHKFLTEFDSKSRSLNSFKLLAKEVMS